MILFIGTVGIMIRFTTIHSIIPHIILHTIVGDGVAVGIHPITAGDGGIHPITVTGTAHIILIMAGVILTTRGTAMEVAGMPIRKTAGMVSADLLEQMYFAAMTAKEGHLLQESVHQPTQPKVPVMVLPQELLQTTAEGHLLKSGKVQLHGQLIITML